MTTSSTVSEQGLCRSSRRGFTLVELMIVVSIVGVLATLAIVGYRKYIESSKVGEAIYIVQSIRAAEESFRAETMTYLNVSTSGTFYPRATGFDNSKYSWVQAGHVDYQRWMTLGVTSDGPVQFGYMVSAGAAGQAVNVAVQTAQVPNWPNPTTEPWYVIQARGSLHGTGSDDTIMLGSSFTGELYWENELYHHNKTTNFRRLPCVLFLVPKAVDLRLLNS